MPLIKNQTEYFSVLKRESQALLELPSPVMIEHLLHLPKMKTFCSCKIFEKVLDFHMNYKTIVKSHFFASNYFFAPNYIFASNYYFTSNYFFALNYIFASNYFLPINYFFVDVLLLFEDLWKKNSVPRSASFTCSRLKIIMISTK